MALKHVKSGQIPGPLWAQTQSPNPHFHIYCLALWSYTCCTSHHGKQTTDGNRWGWLSAFPARAAELGHWRRGRNLQMYAHHRKQPAWASDGLTSPNASDWPPVLRWKLVGHHRVAETQVTQTSVGKNGIFKDSQKELELELLDQWSSLQLPMASPAELWYWTPHWGILSYLESGKIPTMILMCIQGCESLTYKK